MLGAVLPELTALEGIEQSRFHHLDVFDHTVEVLDGWIELEADLSPCSATCGRPSASMLAEPLADGLTRGEASASAPCFTTWPSRPPAASGRRQGHVHRPRRRRARRWWATIFRRLRTSERLRAYVGELTRHHLALGFLVHRRPLDARAMHATCAAPTPSRSRSRCCPCADRLATRGQGQEPWIAAHLELAREVMAAALAWRAAGPPAPPVRGDELARELGMAPGPDLGTLLAALEEAVYAGEVADRDQAVDYARRMRRIDRR